MSSDDAAKDNGYAAGKEEEERLVNGIGSVRLGEEGGEEDVSVDAPLVSAPPPHPLRAAHPPRPRSACARMTLSATASMPLPPLLPPTHPGPPSSLSPLPPRMGARRKRQRTCSTSGAISTERETVIRTNKRVIYTVGRPPWYTLQASHYVI